jgi:hypothetical protein
MQKNMGTTNRPRTSDRKFSGDAYTSSKKTTILMGNVLAKGSYIHGNKRGIFWNG